MTNRIEYRNKEKWDYSITNSNKKAVCEDGSQKQNWKNSLLQDASEKYFIQSQDFEFKQDQIKNIFEPKITENQRNSLKECQNQKRRLNVRHLNSKLSQSSKKGFKNNSEVNNPDEQEDEALESSEHNVYHNSYNNISPVMPQSMGNSSPSLKPSHHLNYPAQLQNQSQVNTDYQLFLSELEKIIFLEVKSMESKDIKKNYILEHVTDDLDTQIEQLENKIKSQQPSPYEILKLRMHIQGISKILVFVHGKSEFRLVISHYYIGQAYRRNNCYEQAIDHFTIALKKNAKLTEIKQTKIYHSFILTSLSQCYFELQMYSDSLQILLRAYEIQQCYVNSELKINNIKTIKLISECYLKMKNYRQAIEYMEKICLIVQKIKGINSKEYIQVKFEKAVIIGEEGNLLGAIEELKAAIQHVQSNPSIELFHKQFLLFQYNKKLAEFLEKFGDFESQLDCLKQMIKIIQNCKAQTIFSKKASIKQIIAIKKKMIVIAVKHSNFHIAIEELQKVLVLEQQKYGSNSPFVVKTLKMLALGHLHLGNEKHAEQYFKKCFTLTQGKNSKLSKDQLKQMENVYKYLGYSSIPGLAKRNSGQLAKKI